MCFRHSEFLQVRVGVIYNFIPSTKHSAWHTAADQGMLAEFKQKDNFKCFLPSSWKKETEAIQGNTLRFFAYQALWD